MKNIINEPLSIEQLQKENTILQEKNTSLEKTIIELSAKLYWFEENFRLSQHRLYGRSSEQTVGAEQISLFNEAEALNAVKPSIPEPAIEEINYIRKKKQKGHREEMLKDLPVETIEYKLSEDEQVCGICGSHIHEMGKEITREIKIIPPQVSVVEHVRYTYACRNCEKNEITTPIITASMLKRALPGSIASAAAIAYIMTQKFMYGVPLYRQEQNWKQLDVEISRQTMANWLISASRRWLTIMFERMHEMLLQQNIICADETTLQVLHEPGRAADTKSYMWLYRSGRNGPPIVLYEYQTTRAKKHPEKFLTGFKGYLCTDGYQVYDILSGVIGVACFAHARRKFNEALKALPKEAAERASAAKEGLDYCNKLFMIERELQDLSPEKRFEARLEKSKPLLDAFHDWLKYQRRVLSPKCITGQAVTYCLNLWDKLTGFLLDGRLFIDNSISERSIKPFVISRKNFLFCNTPNGATASAMIFSIIETAKENGLKPFEYLTYLLEALPNADVDDKCIVDSMLPWSQTLPEACRLKASD